MLYETVHHNGAVPVKSERFSDHAQDYQSAERRVLFLLNLLNITQNAVLTIEILFVVLISALQISVGIQTVAMFCWSSRIFYPNSSPVAILRQFLQPGSQ